MTVQAAIREVAASPLITGVRAKGEYRCAGCGYGVTIFKELPRCPMCGAELWEQLDWSPFGHVGAVLDDG